MSSPTETPIDPDKMSTWCALCQVEIYGLDNWQKHVDSYDHQSKISET